MKTICLLFTLALCLFAQKPYSQLLDIQTQNLQCVMNKTFDLKNPIDKLVNLELTNEKNIKLLFEKESSSLNIYKAFILDYLYQSPQAKEYYKRASNLSDENTKYYIGFLSRTNDFEAAIDELNKLDILNNDIKISKLMATIYIAHSAHIKNSIISKLSRKNILIEDITKELNDCK